MKDSSSTCKKPTPANQDGKQRQPNKKNTQKYFKRGKPNGLHTFEFLIWNLFCINCEM